MRAVCLASAPSAAAPCERNDRRGAAIKLSSDEAALSRGWQPGTVSFMTGDREESGDGARGGRRGTSPQYGVGPGAESRPRGLVLCDQILDPSLR